jgi:3-oxoacyl-[acyl-carrier-protein] synthase-1/3-oxoacyl-[acyl-carrier-protein] synthase II
VGGFDALARFVIAGFESLRATTATMPQPFALGRDGLSIGEGACVLALVRSPSAAAIAEVHGFGAAGEAVHLTAPDREGTGFVRAATRALESAGIDVSRIDLVSAHATSTPFNDAAEARGLRTLLGARVMEVPVHPLKAQIGHTMGAAGALETLATVDALVRQIAPAAVHGIHDPDARVTLLQRAERRPLRVALKLSAAFGGATAALVLGLPGDRSTPRPRGAAYVLDVASVAELPSVEELGRRIPSRRDRLGRACSLSHLALMAVSDLAARHDLAGAGVVVGHAYATIDVNYTFFARVLERGAAHAEPHRFPYTTPQAVAGECAIAFGLTGPNVAVGSGLHGGVEALAVAAELIEAGDAERMVVVAGDVPGEAMRAVAEACGWPTPPLGAVAILLGAGPGASLPEGGRRVLTHEVELGGPVRQSVRVGHLGLLPLCAGATVLESVSPQGWARVTLTS